MANESKNQNNNKSNKKIIIICTAIVLVVVVIAGVIIYNLLKKDDNSLVINKSNAAKVKKQVEQSVKEGAYNVKMNTIWNFKDGKSASTDAYVANPDKNTHSVYIEVTLNDTGEKIYTSPVIKVGSELGQLVLDKDLKAGTYNATCTYKLLSKDESKIQYMM